MILLVLITAIVIGKKEENRGLREGVVATCLVVGILSFIATLATAVLVASSYSTHVKYLERYNEATEELAYSEKLLSMVDKDSPVRDEMVKRVGKDEDRVKTTYKAFLDEDAFCIAQRFWIPWFDCE